MPESDNAVVTYDVRDLLDGIRKDQAAGFARLERGLLSKADKVDLAEIRGELKAHAEQIDQIRKAQEQTTAAAVAHERVVGERREWHRWMIPVLLTVAWIVLAVLQFVGS